MDTLNQEIAYMDKTTENRDSQVAAFPDKGRTLVPREIRETVGDVTVENPRMTCRNVNVYYGNKQAIKNVSLDIGRNEVLSMIGPSGCGKSTFIRCLNRMNDTIDSCRVAGEIALDGLNIYDKSIDVVPLRAQVGMVFQLLAQGNHGICLDGPLLASTILPRHCCLTLTPAHPGEELKRQIL